jgi:hypothetical protein
MPAFDIIYDTQPQIEYRPTIHNGRKSITELRTELQALDSGTYTNKEVNDVTYNDLVYAVRITPDIESP